MYLGRFVQITDDFAVGNVTEGLVVAKLVGKLLLFGQKEFPPVFRRLNQFLTTISVTNFLAASVRHKFPVFPMA